MKTRKLGPFTVSEISFGCMNLSHAYTAAPEEKVAEKVLLTALDLGHTMLDTAALYGFGANETLIGRVLGHRRNDYVLASKCGMFANDAGQREINNDPAILRRNLEDSLRRLGTDRIDLYYLHRWDKRYPIEDTMQVLAGFVKEGKVATLGLSEVSAATIRKAHAVHPITAVQTEYSLWTRNPEIAVLDTCRELGIAFVAFSPLGRGFLGGELRDPSQLSPKDIRLFMPRFQPDNFKKNLRLLDGLRAIAREHDCTTAQLSLTWLLAKNDIAIPIPGTTRIDHATENAAAANMTLDGVTMERLEALINPTTVSGARYGKHTLPEIDTEGD